MIHTPTAVVGVRGTEFDTVVAEDSSSAIAVDEGSV
ncbi:MAG: FecR domain-containing protein [Deltaproteobacteria bacterium]|nr:FecR domain-containing protein [Deltaproteobacteria bacterium]